MTLQEVTSLLSTLATIPLYAFIWKASNVVRGFQAAVDTNTESIVTMVKTLENHADRIGDLELEAAREEGRRQEQQARRGD